MGTRTVEALVLQFTMQFIYSEWIYFEFVHIKFNKIPVSTLMNLYSKQSQRHGTMHKRDIILNKFYIV